MRPLPYLLIPAVMVLFAGCQRNGADPVPSDSPKVGDSRAATSIESRPTSPPADSFPGVGTKSCVFACVRARQMEAVGAEVIEASCRQQCAQNPKAYEQ